MKSCKYCNANTEDNVSNCPSCGAGEFNYVCKHCSAVFDSNYCPNCGKSPKDIIKVCPNCGNRTTDLFCAKCGANLAAFNQTPAYAASPAAQQPQIVNNYYTVKSPAMGYGRPRNKWTAFILCLFFGYFGAHKFYEGKTGMGILYIFTVGLFCFGWIIDCFLLLCKPNPYYV